MVAEYLIDYEPARESEPSAGARVHLSWCSACASEVLHYRTTLRLARAALLDPTDDRPLPEPLVQAVVVRWRAQSCSDGSL